MTIGVKRKRYLWKREFEVFNQELKTPFEIVNDLVKVNYSFVNVRHASSKYFESALLNSF